MATKIVLEFLVEPDDTEYFATRYLHDYPGHSTAMYIINQLLDGERGPVWVGSAIIAKATHLEVGNDEFNEAAKAIGPIDSGE